MVKSLGERIKSARENARNGKGISQAELADLTGINQAALSQIEGDRTSPRKPTLIALSFILNDDFGEIWLMKFFEKSDEEKVSEFNHKELDEIFLKANELSKKSFQDMKPVWEMLKAEIQRRKNLE